MKITCECLINSETGEPLEIEIPDDTNMEQFSKFRDKAWESGARFKLGLNTIDKTLL